MRAAGLHSGKFNTFRCNQAYCQNLSLLAASRAGWAVACGTCKTYLSLSRT